MLGVAEKTTNFEETDFDEALYKTKLLEVFKQFDLFCRENNLTYSVCYGTMLGAIRHKGMIPWDDDVDVFMPREDYDKFIGLTKNGMSEGYAVISSYTNPNYYLRYAKVIDTDTTIIETPYNRNCPIGVFVDVFPIDNYCDTPDETNKLEMQVRKHRQRAYSMCGIPFSTGISKRNSIKGILYKLLGLSAQKEWLKAEALARKTNAKKTSRKAYYGGENIHVNCFPAYLFGNLIDVPFENIKVMCMEKYDAYLTYVYGDYMQMPPKDKQISQHYHYFVDLNRGWTVDELRNAGII